METESNSLEDNICRICLESDTLSNLISPCVCSGTQKYVHMNCLNTWRYQDIENENYIRCNECKTDFIIKKKYSKIKTLFYNITKSLNKHYLYIISITVGLNFLLGFLIDNILMLTINEHITNYFYISGTIINVCLCIIILLIIIIYKYKNNNTDIFIIRYKGVYLRNILFYYIFNIILFFINWVFAIILNIFCFRLFYGFIYENYFKKIFIIHEEILEYSDNNLENLSLIQSR